MQKKIVQAASMAVLLATLAAPAYAQGNGKGHEGGGREFGQSVSAQARIKHEDEAKKDKKEKHERGVVLSQCLKDAQTAYNAALKAANAVRKSALVDARSAFIKAYNDALKARMDARVAARAAFLASAKDDGSRAAYAAAKVKANADWRAAKSAAQDAWTAARDAAETAWKAAKAKADADFKAAKTACAATTPATDAVAPAAITNLSLSGATSSSVLLTWTAPGDDNATGTAASYDVRYSTSPIATDADFTAATQATGEPAPAIAGTSQTMTVTGLSASTTYYFAVKTSDEVPNVSALSNDPSIATLASADATAPAAITSLSLSGATASAVTLTWTAPGDDNATGTAASYDVRYSTSPIATDADFTAATQATGEPAPAIAGTSQTMTVTGLSASTTYYFAVKTSDEVPNVSALSNDPSIATLAAPDTTAPAAITDLSLSAATSSSVLLTWTAPGDDNATGTAASYDVRYSTSPIATAADFAAAAQATGEPTPLVAGTVQTMTVSGLTSGTTYYFAIKAQDEAANVSAMSNVMSLATL